MSKRNNRSVHQEVAQLFRQVVDEVRESGFSSVPDLDATFWYFADQAQTYPDKRESKASEDRPWGDSYDSLFSRRGFGFPSRRHSWRDEGLSRRSNYRSTRIDADRRRLMDHYSGSDARRVSELVKDERVKRIIDTQERGNLQEAKILMGELIDDLEQVSDNRFDI